MTLYMWICRTCGTGITQNEITEVDTDGKIIGCASCQPDAERLTIVEEI